MMSIVTAFSRKQIINKTLQLLVYGRFVANKATKRGKISLIDMKNDIFVVPHPTVSTVNRIF